MSKMIKGWISVLILFGLMGIIALGAVIYSKGWLRKKPPQFTQEQLDERQKRVQADAEYIRKEQERRAEFPKPSPSPKPVPKPAPKPMLTPTEPIKLIKEDVEKYWDFINKKVMEFILFGLIEELEWENYSVYVDLRHWKGMTYRDKKNAASYMMLYCAYKLKDYETWYVEIYDDSTSILLAWLKGTQFIIY